MRLRSPSLVALLQHQCLWILSVVLGAAAALTACSYNGKLASVIEAGDHKGRPYEFILRIAL